MRVLAALVSSLYLPVATTWYAVQPAGTKLLVAGYAQVGNDCVWLTVDPRTLGRRGPTRRTCAQPPGRVVPVVLANARSQWQTVRLKDGPALFRYDDASDTKPVWTYGGGSLWVYDVATTKGPRLVRVSAASGRIVWTIPMPQMYRPLLGADDDGVWLVPDTSGGMSVPGPAPLVHVTPAGRASIAHTGGRAALWIVAHAHTVWMEQISGPSDVSLWRFDGTNAKATLLARPRAFFPVGAVYGDGALWAITGSRPCETDVVFRIDPATGVRTRVASVPALDSCFGPDPRGIAFFAGAVYFLDVPRLYRVEP